MQKRGGILLSVFIILIISSAHSLDYEVTRQINPSQVEVDGTVEVTLYVDVGDSDAYAIDEMIPEDWVIVDYPGAILTDGHLLWIVCGQFGMNYSCTDIDCCVELINDTYYKYTLQAPSSPEIGVISGDYIFDIQGSLQPLPDDTIEAVDIQLSLCSFYDYDESACNSAAEGCLWCPLNNNCELKSEIECNQSRCYDDKRCSLSCQLSSCSLQERCTDNSCVPISLVRCTPDWQCSEWPTDCPGDGASMSRTCSDQNGCKESYTETRSCRTTGSLPVQYTRQAQYAPSRTAVSQDNLPAEPNERTQRISMHQDIVSSFPRTVLTSSRERLDILSSEADSDPVRSGSGEEPGNVPKTPDEMLIENSKTADKSFYLILIIWICIGLLILVFLTKRKIIYNRSARVDTLAHIRSTKQLQEKYMVMDVEAFLALVRKKGTIGLPTVAKKLNVPQKTVEAWAKYLVKEGVLGIQYKFTTAYVYMEME